MRLERYAVKVGRGYAKSHLDNPILFTTRKDAKHYALIYSLAPNKIPEIVKVTVTIQPTEGLKR